MQGRRRQGAARPKCSAACTHRVVADTVAVSQPDVPSEQLLSGSGLHWPWPCVADLVSNARCLGKARSQHVVVSSDESSRLCPACTLPTCLHVALKVFPAENIDMHVVSVRQRCRHLLKVSPCTHARPRPRGAPHTTHKVKAFLASAVIGPVVPGLEAARDLCCS
jgi:hypothetical protein